MALAVGVAMVVRAKWVAAESGVALAAQNTAQQAAPATAPSNHVTSAPTSSSASHSSPAHPVKTHEQEATKQLLQLQLDEKPQFQTGRLSNPSAGAGYSDSATVESRTMLEEYLRSHFDSGVIPAFSRGATCSGLKPLEIGSTVKESVFEKQGTAFLACRRFQAAAKVFSLGLGRYPHSADLEEGLGISLFSAGKIDDSVRALIAASDEAPSSPTPYSLLARACRLSHKEQPAALARLQRFAMLQPRNPVALYEYASALWSSGARTPAAASRVKLLLERAVRLNPNDAGVRLSLGKVYAQEDQWARAISEFKRAIELDPTLTLCHYELALAYSRSGQKEKAEAEMALYQRQRANTHHP